MPDSPILTWQEARRLRDQLDCEGKRLVFTNGCFDLLHLGHARYLQEARSLGHALMVAVNGDDSVRALKGPNRPINPAPDRAELLLALSAVDAVIVFDEMRVTNAIAAIEPHLYVKGGDYTPETLNPEEKAALDEAGTEIEILQLVDGKSTTDTLAKMRQGESRPLRLGVLGSGRGSTLEGLFAAITERRLDAEIAIVLSDMPGARILEIAKSRRVEAVAVHPGENPKRFSLAAQKEMRDRLRAAEVDLVILAGFMRRLKAPLLEAFPERILNIHPSLLPKYPGKDAWTQALQAGETITGATVHLVDAGLDTGRILAQHEVAIIPDDTPETLHARIQEAERLLYPKTIQAFALKRLTSS